MNEELNRADFPRPDFIRKNWMSLNGEWAFGFDKEMLNEKIRVPFCYQSQASGIGIKDYHETVFYSRTFELTEEQLNGEVLLKFGAVDYECHIWLNGYLAGKHTGGHAQFELPISDFLHSGKNQIFLIVQDDKQCDRPRGKQYWKNEADRCWYTNTTGIWKSVWLEFTPKIYVSHVKLTPDIDMRCLELEAYLSESCTGSLHVEISYKGILKKTVSFTFTDSCYLREIIALEEEDSIDEIHYWSTESPNLYDLSLTLSVSASDYVLCYFGMRKIESRNGHIFLNNKLLYQRLVLDQGYWKESLMTPPLTTALQDDIRLTKELGFNGVRKHQKLEDAHYYYYADIMGLLVWCEMPSPYLFNDVEISSVLTEWQEIMRESYNHPCIITWVPFNESWGVRNILTDSRQQAFVSTLYFLTKAYDKTRLISSNDGWEIPENTDLFCIHDYEACSETLSKRYNDFDMFLKTGIPNRQALAYGNNYRRQPFLLSEYGGVALAGNFSKSAWGYHEFASSKNEYLNRIASLTEAIRALPNCCGYCYTQLTDVMQEVNGLLTEEREEKVPLKSLYDIFSK